MKTALILVDIQNDFCPGGALAVPDGDAVLAKANAAMADHDLVVATQDWHPANHGSFAANHPGKAPFQVVQLAGLPQVLWPVHCVQGTPGAEFHPGLDLSRVTKVFPKGTDPAIDSYSGFFDNGQRQSTGLGEWLKAQGVDAVSICGLATDYCVRATALDALRLGFRVRLLLDACRGVGLSPDDIPAAIDEMRKEGVEIN
ncbi:MAG: bifunctional nicotinamidase/pyrazinamidase [Verrucomicrobiota bacterium]|jgi:nicotinamidase/pyrazinamidase